MMTYEVSTSNFSGPLDLLLHLVRKKEIDIADISLADIIDDYLEYMKDLRDIDVNQAGDFLSVAASLLRIKARNLLPNLSLEKEGLEMEELSEEEALVQRLLEYRCYVAVSEVLDSWQDEQVNYFQRGMMEPPVVAEVESSKALEGVSLLGLTLAFKNILQLFENKEKETLEFSPETITVEGQIEYFRIICERNPNGVFLSSVLREMPSRMHVVVSFLALLECIRQHMFIVAQDRDFGEIIVFSVKGEAITHGY